tara:strand:+ start:341 stop:550 length:210 start_codon:yes stop_codon:yes gene_type:complete
MIQRTKVDQIVDDYYDDAEIIDTNPESKYFGDDHNAQQLERIFDECVDEGMSYEDAETEAQRRFEESGL